MAGGPFSQIKMPETRRLTEADIIQADAERAAQAGWLALCELAPQPKDTATPAGFLRWTKAVNKKAQEIFQRLQ